VYFISISLSSFFLRWLNNRSWVGLVIVPVGYDTDRVRHLVGVGCRVIRLNNSGLLLFLCKSTSAAVKLVFIRKVVALLTRHEDRLMPRNARRSQGQDTYVSCVLPYRVAHQSLSNRQYSSGSLGRCRSRKCLVQESQYRLASQESLHQMRIWDFCLRNSLDLMGL
jgi:hypothetical protein